MHIGLELNIRIEVIEKSLLVLLDDFGAFTLHITVEGWVLTRNKHVLQIIDSIGFQNEKSR